MLAQVVAETERDDGMIDLTIEMDAEFEETARTAAAAVGKTLEDWMRDAVIAAVQDSIVEAKAALDMDAGEAAGGDRPTMGART